MIQRKKERKKYGCDTHIISADNMLTWCLFLHEFSSVSWFLAP